ncbi:Histone H1, partial [Aphelenchoides avenae]
MVTNAVRTLNDPQGASYMAITKFIGGYYLKDVNKDSVKAMIRRGLKRAVANGSVTKTSGQGAWGRFQLAGKGSKASPERVDPAKKSTTAQKPTKNSPVKRGFAKSSRTASSSKSTARETTTGKKAATTVKTATKRTALKRSAPVNAIKTASTSSQPAATTSTSSQASQKSTQAAPAKPAGSSQAAPKSDASSQAPSKAAVSSKAPSKSAVNSQAPSKSAGASQTSSHMRYIPRKAKVYSQPVASSTVTKQTATQVDTVTFSHKATSLTQIAGPSNNSVASAAPADSACTVLVIAEASSS